MGLEAATKALLDAGVCPPLGAGRVLTQGVCRHHLRRRRSCLRRLLLRRLHERAGAHHALPRTQPLTRPAQRALYSLGLTGIPVTNVNNNCSTGSTALFQASTLVRAGAAECALALGFEQMAPGSLTSHWPDRPAPGALLNAAARVAEDGLGAGENFGPYAPRMFANAAQEHMERYGSDVGHLAKIGASPPGSACVCVC